MVNRKIVGQHADEAAFLWSLRERAVSAPHYALKDLAALDERVEAHLDGLRIAGDVGWELCRANLAHMGPGEVFALAVLAFGVGHRERMRDVLDIGCASPKFRLGLISALGWLDYESIAPWLQSMSRARSPLHRLVGITACAIHRRDPSGVLATVIADPDPVLRARALRAVGELKLQELWSRVHSRLHDEDDACRFWAAWTITLLGGTPGLPVLMQFISPGNIFAEGALQIILRAHGVERSKEIVSQLAKHPQCARLAILGTGIIGDPMSVPWLIEKMDVVELSRLAGEAFTMITGTDLAYFDLDQDAPPQPETGDGESIADESPSTAYDGDLPWPATSLVARWWAENRGQFSSGTRYLRGQAITSQAALDALLSGTQRQRAAAALELALREPNQHLFEIRARGNSQQRNLAKWTS